MHRCRHFLCDISFWLDSLSILAPLYSSNVYWTEEKTKKSPQGSYEVTAADQSLCTYHAHVVVALNKWLDKAYHSLLEAFCGQTECLVKTSSLDFGQTFKLTLQTISFTLFSLPELQPIAHLCLPLGLVTISVF